MANTFCIDNLEPQIVFPVALAYGESKPPDLDFLQDTINDLKIMLTNGFLFRDKNYTVTLKCVVAVAPAYAMIKQIKNFSGYS